MSESVCVLMMVMVVLNSSFCCLILTFNFCEASSGKITCVNYAIDFSFRIDTDFSFLTQLGFMKFN